MLPCASSKKLHLPLTPMRVPRPSLRTPPPFQVSGSDWKLAPEGQAAGRGQQEPKFSTWEEVRQKQERRRLGLDDDDSTSGGGSGATHSGGGDKSASSADSAFYALLGVPPSASQADIKTAYRQLALKLHPDVNSDEDAAQRFAAVANAYDTLSDVDARKLYDRYGAEGMKRHTGWLAGAADWMLSRPGSAAGVGA